MRHDEAHRSEDKWLAPRDHVRRTARGLPQRWLKRRSLSEPPSWVNPSTSSKKVSHTSWSEAVWGGSRRPASSARHPELEVVHDLSSLVAFACICRAFQVHLAWMWTRSSARRIVTSVEFMAARRIWRWHSNCHMA